MTYTALADIRSEPKRTGGRQITEVERKVAIITGGSRGIGKATALSLAATGFRIALVARNQDRIADAVREVRGLGHSVRGYSADVTVDQEVSAVANEILNDLGPASVLVNCAGGTTADGVGPGLLREALSGDLLGAVNLNTVSILRFSQAVLPHFEHNGGGCIVNVLSILANREMRGLGAYAAAKAAALSLTRTMAIEWAPEVRVNAVLPGHTMTADDDAKRSKNQWSWLLSHVAMGRRATPTEIAEPITFLCSDQASFVTGATLEVHGGSTTWCTSPES